MKTILISVIIIVLSAFSSIETVAQWIHCDSLVATTIKQFTVVGSDIYIETDYMAGPFRSTNNGRTWERISEGLPDTIVTTLAAADTLLFAGTPIGVYKSTDKGSYWKRSSSNLNQMDIGTITVIGKTLFASVYDVGIFRSSDFGTSWALVNDTMTYLDFRSLSSIGQTLFVASGAGLVRSTNNGDEWSSVNDGLNNSYVYLVAGTEKILFAATRSGAFRSFDNGSTWDAAGLSAMQVFSFAVSDGNVFAATESGVYLSTDSGVTWIDVTTNMGSLLVRAVAMQGQELFAGTDSHGVWRTSLSELLPSAINISETETGNKPCINIVFPNPFARNTTIEFTLPHTGFVNMTMLNSLNEEVATLVSEEREAGKRSATWLADNVPCGLYLCRLQVGTNVQTIKMEVVR